MNTPPPVPIKRQDYRPPSFWIDTVELYVSLHEDYAQIRSTLTVRRNDATERAPLILQGEDLELIELMLDGQPLRPDAWSRDDRSLTIDALPDRCSITTVVRTRPQDNTQLEGLYRSGHTFCTQCEAEGFRRITYFADRPDVMARYTTTIEADQSRYPILLSNGNREAQGTLADGRHFVRWRDPFPKPSYLFALVAADLRCHAGEYITRSGRTVRLEIWVEPHNIDACEHALRSLHNAMAWDERVYGLEYDLDIYMVVAVSDFNMAAMENKGLNIFNDKYVLARPQTATDDDYENIEGVIAHEYFHNWTGNRVTCRDWFQLTLKEGLTVFRDAEFSADMGSRAVKRIIDVRTLRTAQFAEDASPRAHPIRPESYVEMNNFYTVTVYNKGAEVIRMIHTLLGPERFLRGTNLYFERHDGQAVTCDDFIAAMADGSGIDLTQFARWYEQVGTPVVEAEGAWDATTERYTLTLRQRPGTPTNAPLLHIPVCVGLVGPDGTDQPLRMEPDAPAPMTTALLELREAQQTFVFHGIAQRPVPSILRGFSAPVKLEFDRDPPELAFAMQHDSDPFNRWDSAQTLAQSMLLAMVAARSAGHTMKIDDRYLDAWGRILEDPSLDGSIKALMLTPPGQRVLGHAMDVVDVEGIHAAHHHLWQTLAETHAVALMRIVQSDPPQTSPLEREAIDYRRLRNTALGLLTKRRNRAGRDEALAVARHQLEHATSMTDAEAALYCLVDAGGDPRTQALATFYARWAHDPLVLDKWFTVQAVSSVPDTLDRIITLTQHPEFTHKNPNRVRALLGAFSVRNPLMFHAADGRGYALLTDHVLALDKLNPQVAARLIGPLGHWRRYDASRRAQMKAQLVRICGHQNLSNDVQELATKTLGD